MSDLLKQLAERWERERAERAGEPLDELDVATPDDQLEAAEDLAADEPHDPLAELDDDADERKSDLPWRQR